MKRSLLVTAVVTFALGLTLLADRDVDSQTLPHQDDVDWDEILGPARGERPQPLDKVVWGHDLLSALSEARVSHRPLFVTLRCVPCKQCADFDKDVLEGGPLLTPLLKQFITVRLTDAKDLDLRIFPVQGFQDMDLSWWGYFLSSEGRILGIFGGRDHVSDSTRISEAALVNTLERVLAHHYDPRRTGWNIDGPRPNLGAPSQPPTTLPGYQSWHTKYPRPASQDCLHCHQVAEVLRQPKIDRGVFDKVDDLAIWPLPENVGLQLDRDHGLRIGQVEPGSPAARAGMQAGDALAAAGGRRLFGQADFRGVLHRSGNPSGRVDVHWLRDGRRMQGVLVLEAGWRRTVLDWRASVSGGNIGSGPGFAWPVKGPRQGIPPGRMSIEPWFGKDPQKFVAHRAGLRPHHTIVAVDGERPDLAGRPFLVWFRSNHDPGDWVTLTVRDEGRERTIRYRLPER